MNDRKRLRLIEQTMEIDELPENDERLLKRPEIKRDEMGRFEQHGKELSKTAKNRMGSGDNLFKPGQSGNPAGRPPGIPNKVSQTLKEMILGSLDRVGGEEYLAKLAIENSSAYAGLIGKVLPTTLAADDSNGGLGVKMTFERVIVWPDGRREIEGVTPKQIAPPVTPDVTPDELTSENDSNIN